MSFNDLKIEKYSDLSVVVYGDTRKYKEDLKRLGGKYNVNLSKGPGWIFPNTFEGKLKTFINSGKRLVTEEEQKAGEELSKQRAKEWMNSRESNNSYEHKSKKASSSIIDNSITLSEYGTLINVLNTMSKKIDLIERGMLMLLNDTQKESLNSSLIKPVDKPVTKIVNKKVIKKNINTSTLQSYSEVPNSSASEDEDVVIPRKRLMM